MTDPVLLVMGALVLLIVGALVAWRRVAGRDGGLEVDQFATARDVTNRWSEPTGSTPSPTATPLVTNPTPPISEAVVDRHHGQR